MVCVGTTNTNKLWALNAATGVRPSGYTVFTAAGPIADSPAVADGAVYFATGAPDNKVYAIDAATGALLWQQGPFAGADFVSSPSVDSGSVYVGGKDGKLYSFDASTGAALWTPAVTGGPILSSPAAADGRVWVGFNDNSLYAYDADTGALLWSKDLGDDVTGSPAVANGVVYVTVPARRRIFALDAATGAKLRSLGTRPDPSSPIVVNTTAYVSTGAGIQAYGLAASSTAAARPDPAALEPDLSLEPSS